MSKLDDISEQIKGNKRPPVDQWKPDHVGEIDIHIDVNGHWFHEGEAIARVALVKLFATILWFEQGDYYLVTPVEKLRISVVDVPFLINQCEFVDGSWVVTDNVQTQTIISAQNPVEMRRFNGQLIPYVRLRYDLWARVNRGVYVEWVEEALKSSDHSTKSIPRELMLTSGGYDFVVAK